MNYPRIMLAALKSGSGKTTITCGLLRALKNQGINPCSFKCGPDYIDPMFHRNALGISAGNLDTFFTDHETTKWIFTEEYLGDIAVIEGVMGLYDGAGGINEEGSSYDLATALDCPIILVVDALGAGKSVLAQIKGFLDYDKHGLIKGVILNKTSKGFGTTLKNLIEDELGIDCLGIVEREDKLQLSSRHLGLVLPGEVEGIEKQLDYLAQLVAGGIDIGRIMELARAAESLKAVCPANIQQVIENKALLKPLRLAVAWDEAFCFYYRENLELLKEMKVELITFSPMEDSNIPEDIDGLLLGGGYPENYLKKLSDNKPMRKAIKSAIEAGLPVLAECGGFMYLMDEIVDKDNSPFEMVGVIKGRAFWSGKLVRFGYNLIEGKSYSIKGHEFHYFDSDNNGEALIAIKPSNNRSYRCMHRLGPGLVGFPHLYYPSSPEFISDFVEAMRNYGR